MKRRSILTGAAAIGVSALCPRIEADAPQHAIRVPAGQDRFNEHMSSMAGTSLDWKVLARDNDGGWSAFESQSQTKGGPPLHLHRSQDEWFYVIEGDFVVQVGEERFHVTAGDSVFAPRQIPHAFAHAGDGGSRMLTVFQPAGSMEDFFRERSKLTGPLSEEEDRRMHRAHGLELLGPPLEV